MRTLSGDNVKQQIQDDVSIKPLSPYRPSPTWERTCASSSLLSRPARSSPTKTACASSSTGSIRAGCERSPNYLLGQRQHHLRRFLSRPGRSLVMCSTTPQIGLAVTERRRSAVVAPPAGEPRSGGHSHRESCRIERFAKARSSHAAKVRLGKSCYHDVLRHSSGDLKLP